MIGRVVLRDLAPTTPGGHPVAHLVGDPLVVSCTAFRDGHGIIAARARWRVVGATEWRVQPMAALADDRFEATLRPEVVARHEVVVEAWTDRYATWRRDVQKWAAAGEDVEIELEEGARILEVLAKRVDDPDGRRRVLDAVEGLRAASCAVHVRMAAGLDDAVAAVVRGVADPWDRTEAAPIVVRVERERAAVGAWYEFFPRSEGGFAGGAIERLDDIAAMGFDVVYLPPIHPIGVTHRKGRHNTLVAGPDDPGSPWAIGGPAGGHTAVEPSLGALDDVARFVARARDLGMEVALDYALQCSPDHPWVRDHPEWFHRRADGSIRYAENPPKKYQDIHPIEFWPEARARTELWEECRRVLEFWISQGIRMFRVDNPHTKPLAFWEWVIDAVQADHPDVVFLAEAFTRPSLMYGLAELGFSQSYTYFTWRLTAADLRSYVEELAHGPNSAWFRPNFWPNTPDILFGPLRHGSCQVFEQRLIAAALLSPSYGIYSGYELCENVPQSPDNEEYHDSEKYRVVQRDWSDPPLRPLIVRLNEIRRAHPVFRRIDNVTFHDAGDPALLAWSKRDPESGDTVLVVLNCEPDRVVESTVRVDGWALGTGDASFEVHDELTDERWTWRHGENYVRFDPTERVAHVFAVGG